MRKMSNDKTDLVSVILDDRDLLSAFAETLNIETDSSLEDSSIAEKSLGRFQKMKCYLWKKAKDIMNVISNKVQILAILAECNFKAEERKIQLALDKKDEEIL